MFNIKNFIKKTIVGKKSENQIAKEEVLSNKIIDKSKNFLNFTQKAVNLAKEEVLAIKEKFKDLRETNYNLGIKHLEKGNIVDATLRFKIIKKAWPEYYDAYYQLAYCLTLKNQNDQARSVIKELLQKNPSYDSKAKELLHHIENSTQITVE